MEDILNGEQLEENLLVEDVDSKSEHLETKSSEGSPNLGKFKSVDELLKAYNNLHSEFTKKCQAYNQLKKETEDNVKTPSEDCVDWQNNVESFLNRFPQAKTYTKKIAEVLSSDKDFSIERGSLEMAYSKVLEEEVAKLNKVVNNKDFELNSVSERTKKMIVDDYLKKLNNGSPYLMMTKGGDNVLSSYKKPSSVSEAGELAKKIFK